MQLPHYRLPRRVVFELGPTIMFRRTRSFAADCGAMVRQMHPGPTVAGLDHVPPAGPFALIANHYEGPGLWIGWAAAILTDAVARARGGDPPVHWLVIGAMDRGRVDGLKRYVPSTAWVFERVAHAWGMVPIARPDAQAGTRAASLRRLIRIAAPASGTGEPVGLFPEGEGSGVAGLRPALEGTGLLLLILGRAGVPVLPAAVWAGDGRLHARFGETWLPTSSDDATVRALAMGRIAALLPEHMRTTPDAVPHRA
jgi:hypothetical protein